MKDALLALGMGGPQSIETIRPFLYNLFSDREIIDFHIGNFPQKLVAKMISSKRSKKIAPEYLKMGFNGASPQNVHTKALLEKLPKLYKNETGKDLDVFPGMCYFHPFIGQAAKKLSENTYEKIIILPLFPQYSFTTSGACLSKLNKHTNLFAHKSKEIVTLPFWYDNEEYCNCIVKRMNDSARTLNKNLTDCFILFSAHSLPEHYLELGDPYVKQIQRHAQLIAKKTGVKNYKISYQSKVGPVKWVGPSTVSTMDELKNNGTDNIIVVPIAFISDHIETLIELDEQLIPVIRQNGLNIQRTACLNSDDDFTAALISIISRRK